MKSYRDSFYLFTGILYYHIEYGHRYRKSFLKKDRKLDHRLDLELKYIIRQNH